MIVQKIIVPNKALILAIKEYLEQYKKEQKDEKDKIVDWWQNYCEEHTEKEAKRRADEQFIFLESKKTEELKALYDEFQQKLTKQEYELKSWQAESVKQVKEKLTADYEWKLENQKQHYMQALIDQKNYYENHFLLVKILLKFYKKSERRYNKTGKTI